MTELGQPRDQLNIYIPQRISGMSPDEILAEVDRIRDARAAALVEIAKRAEKKTRAPGGGRKKKDVLDLSKLDMETALEAMAANLGVTVDELRKLATPSSKP